MDIARTAQASRYAGLAAMAVALAGACAGPAQAAQTFEGTLRAVVIDEAGYGSASTEYRLEQDGRSRSVLPTGVVQADDGARVRITGSLEQGHIVGDVRLRQAPPRAAPGPRSLAVVLVNFEGDPREPWTREEVRDRVFTAADSTSAFFSEESYGRTTLAGRDNAGGDVFGWYTVPPSADPCSTGWTASADAAALADGRNLSAYDNVMYMIPYRSCTWAGQGQLGGPKSWINGELSVRVTAHELGHNLSLHHANTLFCTSGGVAVTLGDDCQEREYRDPWDMMGAYTPVRHNHGWNLERLGFLAASKVQTIEASGRYQLRSALDESPDVTSLQIPRTRSADGRVLDHLSLEIRESGGVFEAFPSGHPATGGVSIRMTGTATGPLRTYLLDGRPASADNFFDATLLPGQTFSHAGIEITLVAPPSGGRAAVDVEIPLPRDTQAPTTPSGLAGRRSSGAVALTWAPSDDDRGVSSYEVYRDGARVGIAGAPGFTDATATPAAHAYEVAALDGAGNVSRRSQPFVLEAAAEAPPAPAATQATLPDLVGPGLRLSTRRRGSRRVVVSVSATDAGGIERLALKIDGRRRKLARGPRLRYSWNLRGVRRGRHRLEAIAVDRNGNRASKRQVFRLAR